MNKSKSWIKSLLIVVMVMLMVFTLVACNNDDDKLEPIPTDLTSGDFFGELWNLTSAIGNKEIKTGDTIAVEFGAVVTVNTKTIPVKDKASELIQQIDLGIELQAVVGRTEATAKDTAVKVRLYDPTNATSGEILTVYLFAKDLDNLYIDFAGKNIKVPNTVADTIWKTALNNTTDLEDNIFSGLENKFIGKDGEKKSINEIIQSFVGKFGPNWNLNSLLNEVVSLAGLDINSLFEKKEDGSFKNEIAGLLFPALGINSPDDVKDNNGDIDIMKILRSNVLETMIKVDAYRAENQGVTFNASVDNSMLSLANGMILDGLLFQSQSGTINLDVYNDVSLRFTRKNKQITDFSIFAKLGGMNQSIRYNNKYVTVIPEVEVKINKLDIRKAGANEIAITENNYTNEIALNEKLTIDLKGISYGDTNLDNAKVELNIVGKLDIVNVENNQTKLNVTLDTVVGTKTTHVVAASFADGKITAVFDKAYKFKDKEYKGVMIDVSKQFNMAKFVQDGLVGMVNHIKNGKGKTSADDAKKPSFNTVFLGCLKEALSMITTDNDLTVTSNNILLTVVNFYNIVNGYTAGKDDKAWTLDNRLEAIKDSFTENATNAVESKATVKDCLNAILGEFGMSVDNLKMPEEKIDWKKIDTKKIESAVKQLLYLVAKDLRIAGVQTKDDKGNDLTEIEIFVNNIAAVLQSKITVNGNLQNGVNASFKAEFANASIAITESLTVVSTAEGGYAFFDKYSDYENASEEDKNDWFVMVLEEKK